MGFAERLREVRKARKMSQTDLANELEKRGFTAYRQTVALWEKGKHEPRMNTVSALAKILDVEVSYLCEAPTVDPEVEQEAFFNQFISRLKEQDGKELSSSVILSCQEAEKKEKLCELAELTSTSCLEDMIAVAKMKAEKQNALRKLARLDEQKLKAVLLLSGEDLSR